MPAAGRPALASSPTMLPLKSLSSRALKRFPTMQRFLAKQDSKTNRASLEVAPDKPLAYADRKWSTLQVGDGAASEPLWTFKVMTYNILADVYAQRYSARLYPDVPAAHLSWASRLPLLVAEVATWAPDVLCLQEVDKFTDLYAQLKPLGYEGVFRQRTGSRKDGCATFWRQDRFSIRSIRCLRFRELGLEDNVALIVGLAPRGFPTVAAGGGSSSAAVQQQQNGGNGGNAGAAVAEPPIVLVSSTHVLFDPHAGDVKLGQVRSLCEAVAYSSNCEREAAAAAQSSAPVASGRIGNAAGKAAAASSASPSSSPCGSGVQVFPVLCGDFNLVPGSAIYDFLCDGRLPVLEHSRRNMSGQIDAKGYRGPLPSYPTPQSSPHHSHSQLSLSAEAPRGAAEPSPAAATATAAATVSAVAAGGPASHPILQTAADLSACESPPPPQQQQQQQQAQARDAEALVVQEMYQWTGVSASISTHGDAGDGVTAGGTEKDLGTVVYTDPAPASTASDLPRLEASTSPGLPPQPPMRDGPASSPAKDGARRTNDGTARRTQDGTTTAAAADGAARQTGGIASAIIHGVQSSLAWLDPGRWSHRHLVNALGPDAAVAAALVMAPPAAAPDASAAAGKSPCRASANNMPSSSSTPEAPLQQQRRASSRQSFSHVDLASSLQDVQAQDVRARNPRMSLDEPRRAVAVAATKASPAAAAAAARVALHPLQLESSYVAVTGAEAPYSSCHIKFLGTLDYIWYGSQPLRAANASGPCQAASNVYALEEVSMPCSAAVHQAHEAAARQGINVHEPASAAASSAAAAAAPLAAAAAVPAPPAAAQTAAATVTSSGSDGQLRGAAATGPSQPLCMLPLAVLQPPDPSHFPRGLPAADLGSDHISLVTQFGFLPANVADQLSDRLE